jgi:phytol kinase
MEKLLQTVAVVAPTIREPGISEAAKRELVRKSLHMLIALVPSIANAIGTAAAMMLLAAGTLVYSYAESLRLSGRNVVLISWVTQIASRPRDRGRFVLGPITLAIGAMLALLLYPAPAATIAIYALAFGDSAASLVGSTAGTVRPRFLFGKSLEGSMMCFAAVFSVSALATGNGLTALIIALAATVLEALPTNDLDNILLPAGVGLIASVVMVA